jgi:hypothetical protein
LLEDSAYTGRLKKTPSILKGIKESAVESVKKNKDLSESLPKKQKVKLT